MVLLRKSDFMFVAGQFPCRNRETFRGQLCARGIDGWEGALGEECLEGREKPGSCRGRSYNMRHVQQWSQPSPQTVLEPRGPAELFLLEASTCAFCRPALAPGRAVTLAPGWGGAVLLAQAACA